MCVTLGVRLAAAGGCAVRHRDGTGRGRASTPAGTLCVRPREQVVHVPHDFRNAWEQCRRAVCRYILAGGVGCSSKFGSVVRVSATDRNYSCTLVCGVCTAPSGVCPVLDVYSTVRVANMQGEATYS